MRDTAHEHKIKRNTNYKLLEKYFNFDKKQTYKTYFLPSRGSK